MKNIFLNCVCFVGIIVVLVTVFVFDDRDDTNDKINTRRKRQAEEIEKSTDCLLPSHPASGWWSIVYNTSQLSPTTRVSKGTVLEINCDQSYKLDGCKLIVCIDGNWIPEIGKCLKTCPSLHSQSILKVTCSYKDSETENCTEPFEGTQAQFSCGYFYRDIRRNRRKIYCKEGQWSENITECVPVCGQATINPTTIIHGSRIKRGEFPWQVALYRNKALICGGSLLSERAILTAAHCVTDDDGNLYPKEIFEVGVGKYYRPYRDSRESEDAQYSGLLDIIIHGSYKSHYQNYLGDIALMITNTTFVFSARVQPVCIDWEEAYRSEILELKKPKLAQVSGWGYTVKDGKPSEVLKKLKIPLISYDRCYPKLPEEFQIFYTHDKICAGYLDKGVSICQGDSGGGLILKLGLRHFIVAIVSVSPKRETGPGCNPDQYALYTQIYQYLEEFILPKVITFKEKPHLDTCDKDPTKCKPVSPPPGVTIPEGGCLLPKHPDHGQWKVILHDSTSRKTVGSPVVNGTTLTIRCEENYRLDNDNNRTICKNGSWTPEIGFCEKTCPSIVSTPTINVTCTYRNKTVQNCEDAIDGTIAKYKCAKFYESKTVENFPLLCSDGVWSHSLPECAPICGQEAAGIDHQGQFPWHIAIYDTRHGEFICSGTLLNPNLLITAAHCVSNSKGQLISTQTLIVAAGKFYQKYDDPRDASNTQFSPIESVYLPKQYKGYFNNYAGDIALIVTSKTFKLSERVQPVCVDWSKQHESLVVNPRENHNKFFIGGWGYYIEGANPLEQASLSRVSLFPRDQCNVDLLRDFDIYMTEDKLCSRGLQDKECRTYAGGGLVFKKENRFYLSGVLSVSSQGNPEEFPCGEYHFFTQLYKYIDNFILKNIDAKK